MLPSLRAATYGSVAAVAQPASVAALRLALNRGLLRKIFNARSIMTAALEKPKAPAPARRVTRKAVAAAAGGETVALATVAPVGLLPAANGALEGGNDALTARHVSLKEPIVPPMGMKVVDVESTDPDNVIPTMVKIQRLLGDKAVSFPRLVVIGNQSAGKSSVLEAIVGEDFLPKGAGMVTRRPLELTLVREVSGRWAEFADGHKIYDFKAVQERIQEENMEVELSDDPIKLMIHSPDVHNVTLVDLPGYIHAVKKGQSLDLPEKIRKLCESYIEKENNVILCVVSAAEDTAMSVGVKEAMTHDRAGTRTMGVVTKMDMVKSDRDLIKTLLNQDYSLGLGYVGVKCRTAKDLENNVPFSAVVSQESQWIGKSSLSKVPGLRLGIPTLRKELSKELLFKISDVFPEILAKLDERIDATRRDHEFLMTMAAERDLSNVAKELEKLVNQFHPTSASRLEFEKAARFSLRDLLAGAWVKSVEHHYDFSRMSHVPESDDAKRANPRDVRTRRLSRDMLTHLKFETGNRADVDRFARMFVFGEGQVDKIDDAMLDQLTQEVLTTGALAPFYSFVLPEDHSKLKVDWQRRLERTVDGMLVESKVVDQARELLLGELLAFVEKADGSGKRESEMARIFFKFLVNKISQRMDEEGVNESLASMMRREKRAVCDMQEFCAATQDIVKTPVVGQGWALFGGGDKEKWPMEIPAYGEVWTKAYFNVVIKRSSNDFFRVLAVELLNPMIFETIHYSLNLFKSGKIFREATAQAKAMRQLQAYREVLVKAQDHYKSRPVA